MSTWQDTTRKTICKVDHERPGRLIRHLDVMDRAGQAGRHRSRQNKVMKVKHDRIGRKIRKEQGRSGESDPGQVRTRKLI